MNVLDPKTITPRVGTNYPAEHAAVIAGREKRVLGDSFGLTQFGVNLTTLQPGSWSAHRHWHEREDEFVFVVDGELTLVDDLGEHVLVKGACAGFKAGSGDAHCLHNRTKQDAAFLEVGDRTAGDSVAYPDDDVQAKFGSDGTWKYSKKDGTPY